MTVWSLSCTKTHRYTIVRSKQTVLSPFHVLRRAHTRARSHNQRIHCLNRWTLLRFVVLEAFKGARALLVFFNGAFVAVCNETPTTKTSLISLRGLSGVCGYPSPSTLQSSPAPRKTGKSKPDPEYRDPEHTFEPGGLAYVHGPRLGQHNNPVI